MFRTLTAFGLLLIAMTALFNWYEIWMHSKDTPIATIVGILYCMLFVQCVIGAIFVLPPKESRG